MANDSQPVPEHVHEAVRASAHLHAEHVLAAGKLTKLINAVTLKIGRPVAVTIFVIACAGWLFLNISFRANHAHVFDEPPFPIMESVLAFTAVLMSLLILTTQQHESRLSDLRAKITLELAILSEQKSAKIIELLDELRRDLPNSRNQSDSATDALKQPISPQAMLDTLQESRRIHDTELLDKDDLAKASSADAGEQSA